MLTSVLLTNIALGEHIVVPEFVYKEGNSDIFVKVCYSGETEVWRKGSFDHAGSLSSNQNLPGLSVGISEEPFVVRAEMAKMFDHIEDGPGIDDEHNSQVLANEFALFQWYQKQLEECTISCYKDDACYATWARMKNWVQNTTTELPNTFPELKELVTADNRYQTWFACHKLNDTYLTKLRDVGNDSDGEFITFEMDSNDVYNGTWRGDRFDHNSLASHYWVKPSSGSASCLKENDDEIDFIKIRASVRFE